MNFVKNRLLQYFPGELKKVAQRAVAYLIETYLGKYTKIRHDQLGFSRNKVLCVKDVELTTKVCAFSNYFGSNIAFAQGQALL